MTREDRQSGPIGHGPSLNRRRLEAGKSTSRLSGGFEGSGDVSQSDSAESMPARKASLLVPWVPVPQTDTGGRDEYSKALERTQEKELGKLTP